MWFKKKDIKTSSTAKCLVLQYVFTSKYFQIPETGQKCGSEELNYLLDKGPQVSDFAFESPNFPGSNAVDVDSSWGAPTAQRLLQMHISQQHFTASTDADHD